MRRNWYKRVITAGLGLTLLSGVATTAIGQQGCPPWAQQRLREIQAQMLNLMTTGPFTLIELRALARQVAELPLACRVAQGSQRQRGYPPGWPGILANPRILQDGDVIAAPEAGIACDSTGCY